MRYWLMRAGKGGIAKDFCIQEGVLAMDWEFGDMSHLPDDPEAFKKWLRNSKEGENVSEGHVNQDAATNRKFMYEVQNGDYVALSNAKDEWVYLGLVKSLYYFDKAGNPAFPHRRKIEWRVAYPRRVFSDAFLTSLKSELTLFSLDKHADELQRKLKS